MKIVGSCLGARTFGETSRIIWAFFCAASARNLEHEVETIHAVFTREGETDASILRLIMGRLHILRA